MATCFICGGPEHQPTPLHEFWSTEDAMAEFDKAPQGPLPSMTAVETLDPRDAIYP